MLGSTLAVDLSASAVDRPSLDELAERARALQPYLLEHAGETEANRRISAEAMQRLADQGLTCLLRSQRYGGFAYGPAALVRIGFEIGRGCGSTSWGAMLTNSNDWFAAYWPQEVQDEIWGQTPGARLAAMAAPTGRCEKVDGGYRISGRWPWGSNCENSEWAIISAMLPEIDGEPQGVGWFLVPMTELEIDQDSWFVSGMQGTGSKTVFVETPVFVPDRRVIRFNDIAAGKVPGCAIDGNTPARFAFTTFGAAGLVGAIIGMADGAVDWFTATVKEKVRIAMQPGTKRTAGDDPFVQAAIGQAKTMIQSGLALLEIELGKAEAKIFAGGTLSVEERVAVRRSLVFAAHESVDAVNLIMKLAGASAADTALPLQRFWRDINAAARHVALDANGVYAMAGRTLLGLPPMGAF
jgi:alkylation response protein AidB-like acyl-CoA dehydrogenase